VPTERALSWIERCEGLDRGWYAAPIGFLNGRGGGELRVALRSALVRGPRARLYAGAGLVAHSEPAAELEETRIKLRALLAPLTEI
jgi:isochorismate synthase EntC